MEPAGNTKVAARGEMFCGNFVLGVASILTRSFSGPHRRPSGRPEGLAGTSVPYLLRTAGTSDNIPDDRAVGNLVSGNVSRRLCAGGGTRERNGQRAGCSGQAVRATGCGGESLLDGSRQ